MKSALNQKQAASKLFTILGDLYKIPEYDHWVYVKSGKLMDEIMAYEFALQESDGFERITDFPDGYEKWRRIYRETLGSVGKEAVMPIESIFKIWTIDETCELPFAKSKGYLLGDSAMHIRFLLEKFQIDIPEGYRNIPDHLSILLELLAYFIENAPAEFTIQFMEDHFDWLEEFSLGLEKLEGNKFYLQITNFLQQVLYSVKTGAFL